MPKANNRNWTYVSHQGNHLVEIKHFLESGNLAIFCDKQIIITDFEVFDDAEYSFFIEQELCRIVVKKTNIGEWAYKFEIVEDIDTPLNRFRKKRSRKYFVQSVLAILGVALLLVGLVASGYWMNQYYINKDIRENGIVKAVKVKVKPHIYEHKFYNAYYVIKYRNRQHAEHLGLDIDRDLKPISPNGLPLENDDEFLLTFSSKNIRHCRMDFKTPTEKQVNTYRSRLLQRLDTDSLNAQYNNCLLDIVYTKKGLSGWANLYYQNIPRKENKKHNNDTYRRMMQDVGGEKCKM